MKKTVVSKALALLLLAVTLFSFTSGSDRYFLIVKNLDIFATLFKEVNTYYVDEVNPNQLMRTGIEDMLKSLDPYTNYIPEDDIENFRTMSTGQYGGIGALTQIFKGRTLVTMVYNGQPAAKAGLKVGDEIVAVDGVSAKDVTREQLGQMLKGQANSRLRLEVKRPNESQLLSLTVTRKKIQVESVPYFGMLDATTGYIKLTEFTMNCGRDVRMALRDLKDDGARQVVLDLRGNPGGLLSEAVNVSNVFIGQGLKVVDTRGKMEEWNNTYKTLNDPEDPNMRLVVLISSTSASASEIVAGVTQDYDRGVLIGQKSFGKGLVQTTRDLSYNSKLKVTTAKYYTPSGRCIQAIDYSHRNPDGSVGRVPDSLISEFKTTRGRLVYDGGGVDPDIVLPAPKPASITQQLQESGLLFQYATQYYYANPTVAPAKTFELTNQEYQAFVSWLKQQNFTFSVPLEQKLEELKAQATSAQDLKGLEAPMQNLEKAIAQNKANMFNTYKAEIKNLLQLEIVGHYYLETGKTEASLAHDPAIQEALNVFEDGQRYARILGY